MLARNTCQLPHAVGLCTVVIKLSSLLGRKKIKLLLASTKASERDFRIR